MPHLKGFSSLYKMTGTSHHATHFNMLFTSLWVLVYLNIDNFMLHSLLSGCVTLATRLEFLSSIVYALEALDGHLRFSIFPAAERLSPVPAWRGSLSAAEPSPCVLHQFLPPFIGACLQLDCQLAALALNINMLTRQSSSKRSKKPHWRRGKRPE